MTQCYINEAAVLEEACKCDNCGHECSGGILDPISDIEQRLSPGSEVPAGQCPECGCLSYVIKCQNKVDTISDALAIFQQIYNDDAQFRYLCIHQRGVWSVREFIASQVMPTIRQYYHRYGQDLGLDFDGEFIGPLINAMHEQKWDMAHNYDSVCMALRNS